MVKKKRLSKRIPAAKRYKIDRKVKEHRRKLKKEAKNKGHSKRSKLKKDPGIPNLYPYKEQLLKQIQDRKERLEDEKQRQKEQRRREQIKRRSLQSLQRDAAKRTKQYEKKEQIKELMEAAAKRTHLRSDSSLKAYYKEFRKVVEGADVILEILDARDPLGCRCFEMEQTVLSAGSNKKLILVLNKIDLVPRENVEKWLKYLRNEFPTIAFKASTQTQKHNLSRKKFPLGSGPTSLEKSSVCLGSEVLMKLLGNYCRNADIKTSITVGIVGLPNVGKSSIINSLKRNRVCTVGATPGVTKSMQEIQLDKHIKLLDSPGIIMAGGAPDDPAVALRNCVKVEHLSDVVTPVEAILRRCDSQHVMLHYTIPEYSNTEEFLAYLARRIGKLKKGGVPDITAAACKVLNDWNSGQIKFYTHPPEQQTLPAHISAEIVREWGKAFDMSVVQEEEERDLAGLVEKMESALVMETSEPVHNIAHEEDEEEDSEVDDDDIEEDMDSEFDDSSEDNDEEMQEQQVSNVSVVLQTKPTIKIKKKTLQQSTEDPLEEGTGYDFEEYFK